MGGGAPQISDRTQVSQDVTTRRAIRRRSLMTAFLIFAGTTIVLAALDVDEAFVYVSGRVADLALGLPGIAWVSTRDLLFGALVGALGGAAYLIGSNRRRLMAEIERRRAAEAEISDSEHRFRDFAEIASHWLWERDAQGGVTYTGGHGANHVVETADGRLTTAGAEIIGAPALEDEQLLAVEASMRAHDTFTDLPLTTMPAADRRAYVLVSGRPVHDGAGAVVGYRGSTRNVTAEIVARRDRQRTAQQMMRISESLRLSEQRFRDFAEAASHYMWESDAERRITFISDGITHLTGERPEELVGRTREDIMGAAAIEEPQRDRLYAAVDAHKPFMDIAYARRAKTGAVVHLAMSGKPYFSDLGQFLGYRGSTRDITAQVLALHEAEQARRDRDFAEASSRAKSEFLANMSHELRTPLNAIMGFSEIISSQLMGPVGFPAYIAYAHDIHESARRLSRIIGDLLDMSRLETGRYDIAPQEIVVADLVRDIVAQNSERALAKGLCIDIGAIDASLRVELDPQAATQVLTNLLANAIAFTPAQGRISVTAVPAEGGAVELFVTDTGIGIADERLEHVFEPFQRVQPHLAREQGGAGIGLWLSRSLMRLHGGDLRLASVEGKGTTATVVVPASRVVGPGRSRRVA